MPINSETENEALIQCYIRNLQGLKGSRIFVALVSKAWLNDPKAMMQLGMAIVVGKPIYFLVLNGTPFPSSLQRISSGHKFVDATDTKGQADIVQGWLKAATHGR